MLIFICTKISSNLPLGKYLPISKSLSFWKKILILNHLKMEKTEKKYKIGGKKFDCPVALASNVINGKWKLQIVNSLSHVEKLRYNVLKSSIENISEKMLIQHLRELETDGLVRRKVYPVVPPMVEYSLTREGRSFIPVILALRKWGEQFKK